MSFRWLLAAILVLLAPAMLRAQTTNKTLSEDFTSGTTSNSWFYFNGACLTAGAATNTAAAGSNPGQGVTVDSNNNPTSYYLPSCVGIQSTYYKENLVGGQKGALGASTGNTATPDATGHGALRFTNGYPGGYQQNGAIVSADTFPAGQGIHVTFKTETYLGDSKGAGGDGADGISFYLLDGCMPIAGGTVDSSCSTSPNALIYGNSTFPGIGAWGGSLAYTCSNSNRPYDGLVGAYLGLGIDEFGNFLNGTSNSLMESGSTNTGGDNTATGGLYQPGRIGLRGSGSISWQALYTAYGSDTNKNTSNPYYPSSMYNACATGTAYSSTANACVSCSSGSYFQSTNTCNSCSNGTYNSTTGMCDNTCATGATYVSSTSTCDSCPTGGTFDATTLKCDNYCSSGTFETNGQYPSTCYICPKGSTLQLKSGSYKCSSGTLTDANATNIAVTTALPQSVAATKNSPNLSSTFAQAAVQKTCSTGHLWNYTNVGSPADAGAASLTNKVNTAGILDYTALPGYYLPSQVISGFKIANESAQTRDAGTPIFYDLTISKTGKLTLNVSTGGSYTNIINGYDVTAVDGPLPSSVRFGFAGSTGGDTNIHEIMCFKAAPDTVSASSVGVNEKQSSKIDTGTQAYFAYYNPVDDTGRVAAYQITTDATTGAVGVASTATWDASCNLTGLPTATDTCATTKATGVVAPQSWKAADSGGRQIITWSGTAGVPFEWGTGGISSAQQTALGSSQDVLNFLRGDRENELDSGGNGEFRTRDSVLGDIIDASPTWVGPPSASYTATFKDRLYDTSKDPLPENSASMSYIAFKQNSTYANRANVVYSGSNDGMLHAFRTENSSGNGTNDGAEILAYMPGIVVNDININSTDPNYAGVDFPNKLYSHAYYVDATPGTGDLFYPSGTGSTAPPPWHTWLAGGLGAGGPGIYILDITDPGQFSEANAASLVIGEWTAGPDATAGTLSCANNGTSTSTDCGNNLGSVYDTPQIRRLHNGTWGVIFGNGLGSSTGDAGVYILTIGPDSAGTGSVKTWYYLSTATGSTSAPNGIAATATVDLDGDKIADYVYAGDLKGNLWRFDLTSNDPTKWAAGAKPLFTTDSGQPITTAPVVGNGITADGSRRVMVAFGTGRKTPMTTTTPISYLTTSQSIYGVWDWNMTAFNSAAGTTYAALATTSTLLPSGTILGSSNLQAVAVAKGGPMGDHDVSTAAVVCFAGATNCASGSNTQFGWSIALPESNGTGAGTEQIVYNPTLNSSGAVIVNSVLPANNSPTSCTINTDEGWTYGINLLTGGPIPNFFPLYNDTNAIAINSNATGTSFLLTTATGKSWLVYQTVTNDHQTTQVNLPANNTAKRLTWIQLR